MKKSVRVKVVRQSKPDVRKLARSLIRLAEQQAAEAKSKPTKKAS